LDIRYVFRMAKLTRQKEEEQHQAEVGTKPHYNIKAHLMLSLPKETRTDTQTHKMSKCTVKQINPFPPPLFSLPLLPPEERQKEKKTNKQWSHTHTHIHIHIQKKDTPSPETFIVPNEFTGGKNHRKARTEKETSSHEIKF